MSAQLDLLVGTLSWFLMIVLVASLVSTIFGAVLNPFAAIAQCHGKGLSRGWIADLRKSNGERLDRAD